MLTPSEYKQIAWDDRQPLRELPESLSEAARFGYNFVYAETNRHFAVDRTNDGRFILYPDMNVNGSLLDDRPMELEPRDGYHTLVFTADVTEMWVPSDRADSGRGRVLSPANPARCNGDSGGMERTVQ